MMQVLFSSQYIFWSGDGGWIHQPPTTRLCFTLAPKPKTDPFQHGKSISKTKYQKCTYAEFVVHDIFTDSHSVTRMQCPSGIQLDLGSILCFCFAELTGQFWLCYWNGQTA